MVRTSLGGGIAVALDMMSVSARAAERYRCTGPDRIERVLRIADPETFTRSIPIPSELTKVTERSRVLEDVCGDHEAERRVATFGGAGSVARTTSGTTR